MTTPQIELDGAPGLWFTPPHLDLNCGTDFYADENRVETISALAICQYPGNDPIFVFACNLRWQIIGDLMYYSVEEAKKDTERYYNNGRSIFWVKIE